MRTEIYETYSEESDMTFIMEDVWNDGDLISTECKGFYFGIPDEKLTKVYYGKLKAEF
jgi:hypothetical protein